MLMELYYLLDKTQIAKKGVPSIIKIKIFRKRSKVPAWHLSVLDSTMSGGTKSIETFQGTFSARLSQTSAGLHCILIGINSIKMARIS